MKWIRQFCILAGMLGCLLFTPPGNAMTLIKRGDALVVRGTYITGDEERLRAALTPEVTTVILRTPDGGGFSRGRELARIIRDARVTTVVHGACGDLICPMMFLAGKERQFSGATRPEASYVRLQIGNGIFPATAGEDRGESWPSVMAWWHDHSHLSYAMLMPQHQPILQNGNTELESKLFFHPEAKTAKGSVMHCWGKRQYVANCETLPDTDALELGIVTTLARYQNALLRERPDILAPESVPDGSINNPPGILVSDECNSLYGEFLRGNSPRAFVVSENGGCYLRSEQHIRPHAEAMDACRKNNARDACRYYTVDDRFVFVDFLEPQESERGREQTVGGGY